MEQRLDTRGVELGRIDVRLFHRCGRSGNSFVVTENAIAHLGHEIVNIDVRVVAHCVSNFLQPGPKSALSKHATMQFGPVVAADVSAPHLDATALAVYVAIFGIVTIGTARKPANAVIALILLDPFAYAHTIGPTTLTLSKIALAGAIAGLAVRKTDPRALRKAPTTMLVLAVLLVAAATALSAWHAAHIVPAIRESLKWLEYAALLAVCALAFHDDPDEQLVRWSFLIVTAAVIALSIPEFYLGAHSGLVISRTEVPRIAGPLEGPNQLAAYLGLNLPVVLAYTLLQGRRWPELFVIAAGILATLMSFSRGGIVALALALLLVAFLCARTSVARIVYGTAALAAIAGASLAWRLVAGGIGLVSTTAHHRVEIHGGLGTRRDLWRAAVELWRAHPFWGIGAGNYELEVGTFLRAPIKTHANSLYLQSLVEGGIPLLAATLFLVSASVAAFVRRARTPLTIAALSASAALAVHFILDLLVFYPKVGMAWMILLGIASADLARGGTQPAST